MGAKAVRSSAGRVWFTATALALLFAACASSSASPIVSAPVAPASPAVASPSSRSADPSEGPLVTSIDGQLLLGSLTGELEQYFVLEDGKETPVFEAEGCNPCVAPSVDGRLIVHPYVTAADAFSTAVYTVATGETAHLPVPDGFSAMGPGPLSPDSKRLLHHGWSDADPSANGIYTTSLDGSGVELLARVTDDRGRDPMDWSPDGASVLIFSEDPSRTAAKHLGDLSVIPAAGGKPVQLNQTGTSVSAIIRDGTAATFSRDGRRVAFAARKTDDPSQSALFVAASNGGTATQLTDWGLGTSTALWSPTEDWILFDRQNGAGPTISIIRPDGSDERELWASGSNGEGCCGTWSPDGSKILFQRATTGGRDLWVMDRDGKVVGRVDADAATWIWYRWTPAP